MEQKDDITEDSDYGVLRISPLVDVITAPFNALISKQAQRAYVGVILFVSTSIVLLGAATIAYWVFYFNYVPQVGVERVVHLQFSDENPWGTALLGSELASIQPYDVSVTLDLPRTPSNLAAGNFMLDLALFSRPSSSIIGTNTSTSLIAHSRRPAILTYASPIVDTAHKVSRMPLYLVGWQREAETLEVDMMESVEFARGWRNLPGSLKFEIQSTQPMQVYRALVKFRAKFTGLRWVMYNWRILSFFTFASMFWGASMVSTSVAWLVFSAYHSSGEGESENFIKEDEDEDGGQADSEKAQVDTFSAGELSDNQHVFPTLSRHMPLRYPGRTKSEEKEVIKQDEIEESDLIPPLSGEADDEAEGVEKTRTARDPTDSGIGTSLDSGSTRGVQRHRSHLFDSHDHDTLED